MTTDNAGWVAVEYASARAFAPTLNRLVEVIEAAGMRIFARIDHAAGAREVGLAMPPATLLIYGHPKGGTPIMLAAPRAALELPLRVLVREDADGRLPGFGFVRTNCARKQASRTATDRILDVGSSEFPGPRRLTRYTHLTVG